MSDAAKASAIGGIDIAGWLEAGSHHLNVRVYFEDTDFSGFVYHATYLRWCERGRSDFLRLLGISHQHLYQGHYSGTACAFAVRRMTLDFRKPARIDEIVRIVTAPADRTKASLTLNQTIWREETVLFQAQVQCVLVSLDGRLLRLPPSILDALSSLEPFPKSTPS